MSQNGPPADPPTLRSPNKSVLFTPVWRNLKAGRANVAMRSLTSNHLGQRLERLIKLKIDIRARVP